MEFERYRISLHLLSIFVISNSFLNRMGNFCLKEVQGFGIDQVAPGRALIRFIRFMLHQQIKLVFYRFFGLFFCPWQWLALLKLLFALLLFHYVGNSFVEMGLVIIAILNDASWLNLAVVLFFEEIFKGISYIVDFSFSLILSFLLRDSIKHVDIINSPLFVVVKWRPLILGTWQWTLVPLCLW